MIKSHLYRLRFLVRAAAREESVSSDESLNMRAKYLKQTYILIYLSHAQQQPALTSLQLQYLSPSLIGCLEAVAHL